MTQVSYAVATRPVVEEAHDDSKATFRRVMKQVNKWFMVPLFRLGLGWFIVSPVSGYIMVLKTMGRLSGRTRYTPLNYTVIDGRVYCLAGWGKTSHWFANLKADPRVELLMPGGAVAGFAEEVTDPDEARIATIQVMRNAGFATLFAGANPVTATDEALLARSGDAAVVRVRPSGLGNGPHDPGGWGWVLPTLLRAGVVVWALGHLRSRGRGSGIGDR